MNKIQKTQILKAYFEKSISKEEMEFLLTHGFGIAPTEWVYFNEKEKRLQEEKRKLISRVFGHSICGIEWV